MTLRIQMLQQLGEQNFDVIIIGGGINGAASAAALTARGASVALIDKGDFGGETSSNSSNLVWGGIKYLENGELKLVSELCRSRNELMAAYPSQIQEMRFLTSVQKGFRKPPFLVYLGTLLYWAVGRFWTSAPRYFSKRKLQQQEPLIAAGNLAGGFEYSDAWLAENDARFTFGFVRKALDKGAVAANYLAATRIQRVSDGWSVEARDQIKGNDVQIRARVLINAAGPNVDSLNELAGIQTRHCHVFSKGIHLIVERINEVCRVMAFFATDGRLFFVIPMGDKTCIGTTDTPVDSPAVSVSTDDRQFVLDNVNRLLNLPEPLTSSDIISERCGVRPLVGEKNDRSGLRIQKQQVHHSKGEQSEQGSPNDWLKMSRKHVIEVNDEKACISLFGGKLTDCVNVGNEISADVKKLGIELVEPTEPWFGEPELSGKAALQQRVRSRMRDKSQTEADALTHRLWRRYGEAANKILDEESSHSGWLEPVMEGVDYCLGELHLIAEREMVTRLDDFLRRRSMLSLTHRKQDLLSKTGMFELCRSLFGIDAEARLSEYQQ
ncbi:MAG: glycerol-3-phosphate dehydrogenase/oxidase, partial [Oceanobacter sp.]